MNGTDDDRLHDRFHRAAAQVTADDGLLDALRAEAGRRRRTRRVAASGLVAVAATAAVVLGIAVVGTDDDRRERVDVVDRTTTTTTTTEAPTTPRARDWDGARFDFGRIEGFERKADEWLLAFDRVQLHTEDGLQSGSDFTQEPIVSGNTDEPTVNENRRVRTYVVRNDAEVLVLHNASAACSGLEQPAPPQWRRIGLEELVDGRLWDEFTQVALTFDPDGFAMRVRLSRGC